MHSAILHMMDPTTPQRSLSDQAVAWLVRLQSKDATDADRAGFASWYAASEAHRSAYSEAEAFVDQLHRPAREIWDERLLLRPSGDGQWTRRWIPAMAVCTVLAVAVLFLWQTVGSTQAEVLKTATGEQRRFQLADGSSVLLNSNTRVRVAYSEQRRELELQSGEAFFVVAKNSERPFEVIAAQGVTRAVGTEFNVRLRDSAATVTVTEGVVQVSRTGSAGRTSPEGSAVQLHPHEMVSYSQRGMGGITPSDAISSLAWQRGQFVFNKKPLGDVIEELNQQWNGHVLVAGSKLRQVPVNGVFDIHDAPAVVRAIERTFHVRSVSLPFHLIVLY